MTQSADTMYIVHPSYAPRKLTRTGHTSWTLIEIDFSTFPSGVHLLRATDKNGAIYTEKIIKK